MNGSAGYIFVGNSSTNVGIHSIDPMGAIIARVRKSLNFYASIDVDVFRGIPSAVCLFGVVTNLVLMASLIKFQRYRSITFIIIISLALTDFGACLTLPVAMLLVIPQVIIKELGFMCNTIWYIGCTCNFATVYHLCVFAVIRFLQLTQPIKARSMLTPGLVFRLCCFSWLVSLLASIFAAVYFNVHTFSIDNEYVTICAYPPHVVKPRNVCLALFLTVLPLCIILCFHVAKHVIVSRRGQEQLQDATDQRRTTDARALMIVLILFFVTFSPTALHTVVHDVAGIPNQPYHNMLYIYEIFMRMMGSVIDPWIYAIAAKRIRDDMINFLFRRPRTK